MNKNQIKGAANKIAGKIQQNTGGAAGSEEQRAKGASKRTKGSTQKATGDSHRTIKNIADKVKRKI